MWIAFLPGLDLYKTNNKLVATHNLLDENLVCALLAQPVSAAGLHSVAQYLVAFWTQILHQIAAVAVVIV